MHNPEDRYQLIKHAVEFVSKEYNYTITDKIEERIFMLSVKENPCIFTSIIPNKEYTYPLNKIIHLLRCVPVNTLINIGLFRSKKDAIKWYVSLVIFDEIDFSLLYSFLTVIFTLHIFGMDTSGSEESKPNNLRTLFNYGAFYRLSFEVVKTIVLDLFITICIDEDKSNFFNDESKRTALNLYNKTFAKYSLYDITIKEIIFLYNSLGNICLTNYDGSFDKKIQKFLKKNVII